MIQRCSSAVFLALVLMCAMSGLAFSQTVVPLFVWVDPPSTNMSKWYDFWSSGYLYGPLTNNGCCQATLDAEALAVAAASANGSVSNSGMAGAVAYHNGCHRAMLQYAQQHVRADLTYYTQMHGFVLAVLSSRVSRVVCNSIPDYLGACFAGTSFTHYQVLPLGQQWSDTIPLHCDFINLVPCVNIARWNELQFCSIDVSVLAQLFAVFFAPGWTCPPWVAQPINVIDGDMRETEEDLEIKTPGLPLTFNRSYNSRLEGTNALGPCWTHTYDWRLYDDFTNTFYGTNTVPVTNVWKQLRVSSGNLFTFQRNTNGTYTSPRDNNYQLVTNVGGYRVTIPNQATYDFDSNGMLQVIGDSFNNQITLSYTNSGSATVLARAEHSGGKALEFLYTSNLLTEVRTPSTNLSVLFSYNSAGELTGTVKRLAQEELSTKYAYDAGTHSLTQRVDAAGRIAAWEYDGGRSTRSYNSGTGTWSDTSVAYDTNLHVSTVTYNRDGSNIVYEYRYHPVLQRVSAIYGPNSTNMVDWKGTEYTLDDYGNTTEELEADWSVMEWARTRTGYDVQHHVTNRAYGYIAEPSNFWVYAWDTTNQTLTCVTDPEGRQVRYEYTNGLVTAEKLVYATNVTFDTTYSYDTNGYLAAVTNANGHWVQYVHGGCCPDEITPQDGPSMELEYDDLRHLKYIRMPGETGTRVTTFNPDELGRVRSIVYPDALSESFAYDGLGNLLTNVDRAGRTTRYTYGIESKPLSISRILGATQEVTVAFSYDSLMNLTRITDPLGRTVKSYVLDNEDRPVQIMNVDSQQMTVVYGLGDKVKTVTRFDGTQVTNTYDKDGRLWMTAFPGTTNTFAYYRNDLLKTVANEAGIISNTYDTVNRLTSVTQCAPSGNVSYTYLPAGNVSSVVSVAGTTIYAYDAAERVSSVERQGSSVLFSYNTNNGLMSSMTYPNGVQCSYQYDVMDRITGITWTGPQTNVLRSFAYGFDAAGMITNILRETGEGIGYTYDTLDRLTGERHTDPQGGTMWDSAYSYDLAGNRLSKTRDDLTVSYSYGSGDRLTDWTASSTGALKGVVDVFGYSSETNGVNPLFGERTVNGQTAEISGTNFWVHGLAMEAGTQQLIVAAIGDEAGNVGRTTNTIAMTVVTNAGYSYDLAGNITNIAYTGYRTLQLKWDGQYRLLSVSTNGTSIESNRYDALGRRISVRNGTNTTYFVYDGLHIVAEVGTSGSLLYSYTYGPGIDNILSMTAYGSTTTTYYYIKDHLGTVAAIADGSGNIVESYRYDAWGRVSVFDTAGQPLTESAVGNRFLFQGREYSWSTGLYYFRARWYDPITGRWLSNDPIDVLGGLNQYVFVGNNPVNIVDPFGLCTNGTTTVSVQIVGGSFAVIVGLTGSISIAWDTDGDVGLVGTIGWGAGGYVGGNVIWGGVASLILDAISRVSIDAQGDLQSLKGKGSQVNLAAGLGAVIDIDGDKARMTGIDFGFGGAQFKTRTAVLTLWGPSTAKPPDDPSRLCVMPAFYGCPNQ